MPASRRPLAVVALAALAATTQASPAAGQSTLGGYLTVDNTFWAYVSTSPTVPGTQVATGSNWGATYSFSGVALAAGQDYWLQVLSRDVGVISSFIGRFTLSGGGHLFSNGAAEQVTNTTDWQVGNTGFGQNSQGIRWQADNGGGPWGGYRAEFGAADWIWSQDDCTSCDRWFSTKIVATQVVPEPETWMLLATGLAALGLTAARRRRPA